MKTLRFPLLAAFLLAPVLPGGAAAPALPTVETTLSVLEPVEGACEWRKFEPLSSASQVLARLPAGCQGGSTALSQDGKRGAVRFWRGAVSMPVVGKPTFPEPFPSQAFRDRLFLVELATGEAQELPLPPEGELIEYGFDAQGRLLGLSLQGAAMEEQASSRVVELDGTGRARGVGGGKTSLRALGFAFQEGKWTRLEVKASSEVLGTAALELRKELGERSIRALDPRFEARDIEEDEVLDQLYELSPDQPEGQWAEFKSGSQSLAVWGTPFGNDMLATGLVRRLERGKVVALPSYPYRPNDMMSLKTRGPYLLISLSDSGGHPRMYRGNKRVWSSETARAVTFWPK
ncbi:hypothetical protein POL68_23820 [Stigmatella sp. ncwal1]|uniref:Uncharacterized protein n=1 Tax=Stigmatella ashevillensis TaxID=2995309 RepID=A0ABT5DEM1_9BACT|nr:hypothetical protein [Stigmatella ashevillena]MDC0711519.1 hypothetical protein [Stigmatella ashevillena]